MISLETKPNKGSVVRILFLASDPSDTAKIRLGKELQEIRDKLKHDQNFEISDHMAVKPNDVLQTIIKYKPHIVHFSGHGYESGELCFENEEGKAQPMPNEALSSLFRLVSDHVKCVVVNTCFSETQARAIAQYIPAVVGTKKEIGDKAAIGFSLGFYTALEADLSQNSIKKAFEIGQISIQFNGSPLESSTPVLILGLPEVRFSSEVEIVMSNLVKKVGKSSSVEVQVLRQALTAKGLSMGLPYSDVDDIIEKYFLKIKDYKDKLTQFEKAYKDVMYEEYPISEDTKKALLYLQDGLNLRSEDVNGIIEKLIADPKWTLPEACYDRGRKKYKLEDYQQAIKYFTDAIEAKRDYSSAYYERGFTYYTIGDHNKAIDDYTMAIKYNKNWFTVKLANAYFDRGYTYYNHQNNNILEKKEENLQKAIEDWSKTIELDPTDHLAHYNIGLCYTGLDKINDAIINYENAARCSTVDKKSLKKIYTRLGQHYNLIGNKEKSDEYYDMADFITEESIINEEGKNIINKGPVEL